MLTLERRILAFAWLSVMGLAGASAAADEPTHVGVAVTGGLSGFGADLGVNLTDYLGLRATVAGMSISHNGNYGTNVSWDARLRLFQAGLLLDMYPFAGSWRLSAGVVKDGNKFTMNGQPTGSTFTFNGNSYPSAAIPSAAASVDWSKSVPYLGMGWGNLTGSRGLHMTSDFGLLITGNPNATINVACNPAAIPNGSSVTCSTLTGDVAAEQAKLQNDVNKLKVWPVLRVGIGFAF